ncbi:MAG: Bax inhibitor-1/YccA family protein [Gammaproteobacteria bacterium]|jgi:modulator of FtsH protease|nr:Bax inhibitor-1/YccA family protein [Gammaproteobacteria bacterium]
MADRFPTVTRAGLDSILETNSVIRNTYILLGLSLGFSALTAYVAMITNAKPLGLITLVIYFGLIFLINATRNSSLGIVSVFVFTGFLGYTLGPLLNFYLYTFVNGKQLIFTALGGTGIIFFALSGYALTTRKDFSYLGGFLLAGMMVLMLCIVAQIFFPMPMLQLATSAGFMLFSAGIILFETSQIIHGGERNYIMATVSIYVALYNMFISLLQILSFFSGQRE